MVGTMKHSLRHGANWLWAHPLWLLVIIASLVSLAAVVHYYSQGVSLIYFDAQARLMIARRVVDSPTPGLAQLGGVWPPLTHILALPFIHIDWFYQSGFALIIFSMLSFIGLAVVMYHMLFFLTGEKLLGIMAALAMIANPNIIYMQSTSMTELPTALSMAASVYFLLRLGREPENPRWVILNGIANVLGCMIRYEVWILVIIQVVCVAWIYTVRRVGWKALSGRMIYWGYFAFAGIGAWVIWNWIIFGDPLTFQRGEYSKPSLWVTARDPVIGNLPLSFATYWHATLQIAGPLFLISLAGLVVYMLRTRLRTESIGTYSILGVFPAFVLMLYLGQRPMQVAGISGEGFYNIRFALIMLIPIITLVVYLARGGWLPKVLVGVMLVGSQILMLRDYGIVTLRDPLGAVSIAPYISSQQTAAWLAVNYDGRPMLMEGFSNEIALFQSGIPLRNIIYEGSYRLWDAALEAPQDSVDWVYMRQLPDIPDKVWTRWNDDAALLDHFEMVFENDYLRIYRRIGLPALASPPLSPISSSESITLDR